MLPFRATWPGTLSGNLAQDVSKKNLPVTLRPIISEDDLFLYEVYASTRREEVAAWGWDEAQQEVFLKMQLRGRDQSYRLQEQQLEDQIILFEDRHAGRLIVSRAGSWIRLVDITLLPQYRGRGIGTFLIEQLCGKAAECGGIVQLEVSKVNTAAARLYRRLEFAPTGENELYMQMEWRPTES